MTAMALGDYIIVPQSGQVSVSSVAPGLNRFTPAAAQIVAAPTAPAAFSSTIQIYNLENLGSVRGKLNELLSHWDGATRTFLVDGYPLTTNDPILKLSQQWINVNETFTGIELQISDSGSSASSSLIDMKVNNVSKFLVTKAGRIQCPSIWMTQSPEDTGFCLATSQSLSGVWPYGSYYANLINITDTANAADTATNAISGLHIQQVVGGSLMRGGRAALWASLSYNQPWDVSYYNPWGFIGSVSQVVIGAHCNGAAYLPQGQFWGSNIVVGTSNTAANAAYLHTMVGLEIDIGCHANSSVATKNLLRLSNLPGDFGQGSAEDACILICAMEDNGWQNIMLITNGYGPGDRPIASNGTILKVDANVASPTWTIKDGINLDGAYLTITDHAFRSKNFAVTGNGAMSLWGGVSGASPIAQLNFGSYYQSSGTPLASHIALYGSTYGFGITAGSVNYISAGSHSFYNTGVLVAAFASGLVVGAPTGGDKGAGTINVATDIYKNNTAYSNPDFVFEKFYRGKIEEFESTSSEGYEGLPPLDYVREYTRAHLRLPRIGREPKGIFERSDLVLEKLEEAYLHILELHERLKRIEDGKGHH